MSDRLHDHWKIGFRRGCVACAQTEADHALSAKVFHAKMAAETERPETTDAGRQDQPMIRAG